jgi:hypothetical protein
LLMAPVVLYARPAMRREHIGDGDAAGMTQVVRARKAISFPSAALVITLVLGCRAELVDSPVHGAGPPLWFEDLGEPLVVQEDEAGALGRRVMQRLVGASPAALPPRLAMDEEPRVVFVSISTGREPARVALGAGPGVGRAVDHAVAQLRGQNGSASALATSEPVWIKIDVVEEIAAVETRAWDQPLAGERSMDGLEGLAFERWTGLAFVAEELVSRRLVDSRGWLERERVAREAARRGRLHSAPLFASEGASLRVRRFTARSFFFDGQAAHELYRGHVRDQPIEPERLRAAVRAGARYLARMADPRGRFVYSYLAKQDRAKNSYNMVRHAGTVFSMLQAWQVLGEADILAAAERAIAHMIGFIEPFGGEQSEQSVLAHGGKIKLGGVALAALALVTHAELTGKRTHIGLARRLCRYIRASQRKDGSFLHLRLHPGGQPGDFISQYYPGEALLALVSMHRLDRDPVWLDTAEAGARYLIEVRDRDVASADLIHDHWLLYALEGLYAERPDRLYLGHAMRIARAIMGKQNRSAAMADHTGAYGDPPRSTPVATRNEGLMAAHRMARASGQADLARDILDAVVAGARVELAMQIDPARAMYLDNPRAALGGFTRSYTDFEVRIDYVQHNLSALIALMAALDDGRP